MIDASDLDSVVRALANENRRQILRLCTGRFVLAGDIAAASDLAPASVSEHLKALRKTGLVELRREGTRWLYRTDADRVAAALAALADDLHQQPRS